MFKNHFKIAWRNLVKDRQFSLLNLIGLATGLACALFIFMWVNDERSVDKFNEKDSQLYQVMKTAPGADGSIGTYASTPALLEKTMVADMPEIEHAVAIFKKDDGIVSVGNRYFKATPKYVDTSFFNVFSYPLLRGDKRKVLSNKYGVLLSGRLAMKLFNTIDNIIGKTITWDHGDELNGPFVVAGVFEAPPANASSQFDMLFSYEYYYNIYKNKYGLATWGSNSAETFVILKKGVDPAKFNEKIIEYSRMKYKAMHGTTGLEWEGKIFLQRYSDRYLYNHFDNGVLTGGRIQYVNLFTIIAIFILAIACINFMNLSTAKASKRMKEVGIRKVVGARRGTLVLQYMSESILMALLSLVIAMVLVLIFLSPFRAITGKQLSLHFDTAFILTVLGITLLTGLIAGSYPALYLSGFKPVLVLKGKLNTSAGESWVRKGLVVFQFTISAILIIAVFVVYKQMELIQTKNLGYNKDNIIRFSNEGKLRQNQAAFFAEVKKIPGVIEATGMGGNLVGDHGGGGGISWPGKKPDAGIEFSGLSGDFGLIEMLGLRIAQGRSFSRQFGADSSAVIFNETAIAAMGLKDPVGKTVKLWGEPRTIVGIVKDFHFESLYQNVTPMFLKYLPQNDNILVKIKVGTEKETLARLDNFYKQYNMGLPFEYKFLDDDYQALYASEQRVSILSRYFAGIAIIICCLGLFGLAAFTAQKRHKEIGIRKVIGASVSSVAVMLSKDFLKLVIIAVLIAFPLAWWAMHGWLQSFAYRVDIGAGIFLAAGGSIILITICTISFQAIKAAVANPVRALRSE